MSDDLLFKTAMLLEKSDQHGQTRSAAELLFGVRKDRSWYDLHLLVTMSGPIS